MRDSGNGTRLLVLVNLAVFVLDVVLGWAPIKSWHLPGGGYKWWQLVSSCFCHYSWSHLSSNLFMLYIFGRLVEEEDGFLSVWGYYLLCGLGMLNRRAFTREMGRLLRTGLQLAESIAAQSEVAQHSWVRQGKLEQAQITAILWDTVLLQCTCFLLYQALP